MGSGILHDDYDGAPETHRSMEELGVVRELLSEARDRGEPFGAVWGAVLELASPDVRAVLHDTTATWRAAYRLEPVEPRESAAAALV